MEKDSTVLQKAASASLSANQDMSGPSILHSTIDSKHDLRAHGAPHTCAELPGLRGRGGGAVLSLKEAVLGRTG